MFCIKCGSVIPAGAKFCPSCGEKVNISGDYAIKLISAVCPQCGAKIKVNPDLESGKCDFCGNTIMVDRAIQKYYSLEKKFINNGIFNQAKKDNKYTVELEKAKENKYVAIMTVGSLLAAALLMLACAILVWALQFI